MSSTIVDDTRIVPWPISLVWRYLGTAVVAVAGFWALDSAVSLPVVGDRLPFWPAAGAVALGAPMALGLAWRAATRPPRAASQREAGGGESGPYGRDEHARLLVDRRGYLFARRVLFSATGLPWRALRRLPRDVEQRFAHPVPLLTTRGQTWWMAGNEFYRVTADYSPETARAVVEALRWRRRPRLDLAASGRPDGERREEIVRGLRPSLGRHVGVVCVSCRATIDLRAERLAELWTQAGLRSTDVTVLCRACETGERPAAEPTTRTRRPRRLALPPDDGAAQQVSGPPRPG